MLKEFKKFIARGNVMELAVGLIMGAAFTAIVTSLNNDILSPLLSIPLKTVNLSEWQVPLGNSGAVLQIGAFLQSIITFLITAFCLFLVVKALNKLTEKTDEKEEKAKEEKVDNSELSVEYLKEIRDLLEKKGQQ